MSKLQATLTANNTLDISGLNPETHPFLLLFHAAARQSS